MPSLSRAKWAVPTAACFAFVLTVLYRYLAAASFPNDEHEYLAGAQQILLAGEWPTKDFFDPGRPLMYVASAAAQMLFGQTLFAEAVFTSIAFGAAAALVLIAAHRLSGSLLVAIVASLLSVATFPRPFAYPKILLYAAGPLLMWAWVDKPTFRRMAAMALFVAVSFMLRHDHGVYLGGAVAATILFAPATGTRERIVRLASFGAIVFVLLLPYLVYLQMYEGFASFMTAAWSYSSREADRTRLDLSELGWGPDARLFFVYYLLPLAMLAWFAIDWFRHRRDEVAIVVPLAALALVINVGFIRDPVPIRVADAIVPAVLCGAWLAGRAARVPSPRPRVIAASLLALVATLAAQSVFVVGRVTENLNRTDLQRGIGSAPAMLRYRAAQLQDRFEPRYIPSSRVTALVPFFEYLDRCTTTEHRLFVAGYAPEIFTYARRLFAGGHSQFIQGYQVSAATQQQIIERLERQFALFALMLSDEERQWKRESAPVDAFINTHFEPMAEISEGDDRRIRVLIRTGADALRTGTDKTTGWPCFR